MIYLDRISPETLRTYAACLLARRETGSLPSPEAVETIARAEGASPTASLALARGELRAEDGTVVPLGGCCDTLPPAVVPDIETGRAVMVRGGASVRLRVPGGRVMRPSLLPLWIAARER